MKLLYKAAIAMLAFGIFTTIAYGQTAEIKGMVADSVTTQSIEFVTVALTSDGTKPLKTTYTHSDGTFQFSGVPANDYILVFNYIGYQQRKIGLKQGNKLMQTVYLTPHYKQLKDVVIHAAKPLVKQEADRITYDLQADPDSKGNSVFDMLRKIPYLSVDASETILLKGSGGYKIFINGKPSGLVENNPNAVLKSMPASTIQKIEVITNPSSKYDAEGVTGVINIITVKKLAGGYNGSLNTNLQLPGGPGVGGSFNAKFGSFGISAYGGGSIYRNPETYFQNTRTTATSNPTNLDQTGLTSSTGRSGYVGTELSYELDSLNLISAQFNINGSRSNADRSLASLLKNQTTLQEQYRLDNNSNSNNSGLDAAINYQLGFQNNKNRLLTLSYRYLTYSNQLFSNVTIRDRYMFSDPDYEQNNEGTTSEHTLQADYVHPVKKVTIEAGLKSIYRNNTSNFNYLQLINNNYELVSDFSNGFNNKQLILAAYNSYRVSLKGFDFSGGLRLEHTNNKADFTSTSSKVQQNYINLVPSFSINHNFKNYGSINLGFSQRIQRPGINRLNPFVNRSNPSFVSTGNPQLKSSAINNLQIGYNLSKKLSLNAGFTYTFLKNLGLQISTFDPVTNITYVTYQNIGKGNAYAFNLNIGYPITKAFNFNFNGNAIFIDLDGVNNGQIISTGRWSQNLSSSLNYRLKDGWRINANFNFSGRNQSNFQSISNAVFSTTLGLNKDIIKNKLSFAASVNNPFNKYRLNIVETKGANFIETNVNQSYFRSARISINYNFGKLKEGIKKAKRGIKNDDLSN